MNDLANPEIRWNDLRHKGDMMFKFDIRRVKLLRRVERLDAFAEDELNAYTPIRSPQADINHEQKPYPNIKHTKA